jgi:PPM family protein phosphatase
MENIIAWLNTPLTEDGSFRLWMLVAACALAVIILLAFLNRKHRQKKTKRIERKTASVTEKPKVKPNLEIANLQGLSRFTDSPACSASSRNRATGNVI